MEEPYQEYIDKFALHMPIAADQTGCLREYIDEYIEHMEDCEYHYKEKDDDESKQLHSESEELYDNLVDLYKMYGDLTEIAYKIRDCENEYLERAKLLVSKVSKEEWFNKRKDNSWTIDKAIEKSRANQQKHTEVNIPGIVSEDGNSVSFQMSPEMMIFPLTFEFSVVSKTE